MLLNLLKWQSKKHALFILKLSVIAVMITAFSCPAIAKNNKVNFSDSSGEEYEKGSDKLDVPYVPTPMELVRTLLNFGSVGPNDFLIDLGSGDGRIVITAAKEYGVRGFGVDLNSKLVELSRKYASAEGVANQTVFLYKTFSKPTSARQPSSACIC